ncbi:MAG: saccharopine dehydrogenase NADP-binding domain-containing protein [Spirochaetales bacterium]|uniref:Saccharopine dehydrogenase NADP-binding domain-containing protein n=1 Tax=Candidatus Thalassospirochaeta sargassi TaxID=3119039 RepID=A0AAJ1MJC3_9SPIO|nr:saccharopine dehydrogenase NADP-binding domain-containing protein [Spirochaetales bacterium]
MKRLLVLGSGAQGSTVAKRMDEEPNVAEIICADYDEKAVSDLAGQLKKGKALQIDARNVENIVKAAVGVDLIVNALPMAFGRIVIEAALKAGVNYQDFAAADDPSMDWVEGIRVMLDETSAKFRAIGKTAVISTGSAPGIICVAARDAVRELDSCETINMYVWEGVKAKRFLPFWWSPEVAYADMSDEAFPFVNGNIIASKPFELPVTRDVPGSDTPIRFVEHAHDETVLMGLNSEKYFKGVRNVYFKYGGYGVDFAENLYKMGLLSEEPIEVDGQNVIPRKVALKLTPPAPKYHDEIKEILNEGLIDDSGAMIVEAIGTIKGKKVMVETHVNSLSCVDAFEKSGLTGETYFTGQGGALFTKLFVNDKIYQSGLISSDMLEYDQIDYYLEEAAKLDITLDKKMIEL